LPSCLIKLERSITAVLQTLTQAYKRELHKFDTQRVIVAWDGLVSKQQAALEALGVPVMYVSDLTSDREVQTSITFFVTVANILDRRLKCPLNPTETATNHPGT